MFGRRGRRERGDSEEVERGSINTEAKEDGAQRTRRGFMGSDLSGRRGRAGLVARRTRPRVAWRRCSSLSLAKQQRLLLPCRAFLGGGRQRPSCEQAALSWDP